MKRDSMCTNFLGIDLIQIALLDRCNIIFNQSGLVVSYAHDFLGNIYAQNMTSTFPSVVVI